MKRVDPVGAGRPRGLRNLTRLQCVSLPGCLTPKPSPTCRWERAS